MARFLLKQREHYEHLVVVVSALKGETQRLLSMACKNHADPPPRECDMLLTAGERMSMALLAIEIHRAGGRAVSLTGSQSGILTNSQHGEATIVEVRPKRIESLLSEGCIVIVAGFQGVSREGEITTLGRGGSDITATALGAALQRNRNYTPLVVIFLKDVGGVYGEDPKGTLRAQNPIAQLSYEEAFSIVKRSGGENFIIHPRALSTAHEHQLSLHFLPFSESLNACEAEGKGGSAILPSSIQKREALLP